MAGLRPYRIAESPPVPGEHTRVYVIGHPYGQVLSFSIHDSQLLDHRAPLLHSRAPTDPGSSGSPIFDRDWDLVGLHHAGDHRVSRLHGTGTYAANEGIWIQSIRGAIGGTPPRVDVQPAPAPQSSLRETRIMSDLEARIRAAVERVESRDPELAKDMEGRREEAREEARRVGQEMAHEGFAPGVRGPDLAQETIVLRVGRPVLRIANDDAVLDFSDAESRVWRERLLRARERLIRGARAVGRVEVEGHELDWIGTGVLVAPDVIATNRHVAEEFGVRGGAGFVFRPATVRNGTMAASIDFLEEFGRDESRAVRISKILHIEDASGPDLALLQVEGAGAQHVTLARAARKGQQVAVIGYPARDSRIPDVALMDRIFGDVYDKKRLAPGQLTDVDRATLRHDCTTLGGNSGSPVFDLETGEVVGLHFAGRFLEANFAVPARLVADRLRTVRPEH
ncbi:MAG TPA: serine protease, partial [Longimicrobium sp.]|nr:serine protease [Longimicrobium sp.]